jgi:uncharacterized protein
MVVRVEQIAEEGLQLNELIGLELLTSMLSEDGDTGFRPTRPSRLNATLRKMRDGVLVRAQFTVQLTSPCKRCLLDVVTEIPVPFTLNLMKRAARGQDDQESGGQKDDGPASAGSFGLEDADQDWFNGKTIDFDPILREQLLLALPMHVVCREECKGLCSVCGQDLNVKSCGCEQKAVDPRLAKLKYIKLN